MWSGRYFFTNEHSFFISSIALHLRFLKPFLLFSALHTQYNNRMFCTTYFMCWLNFIRHAKDDTTISLANGSVESNTQFFMKENMIFFSRFSVLFKNLAIVVINASLKFSVKNVARDEINSAYNSIHSYIFVFVNFHIYRGCQNKSTFVCTREKKRNIYICYRYIFHHFRSFRKTNEKLTRCGYDAYIGHWCHSNPMNKTHSEWHR